MIGWIGDFFRFWWALIYWNARKTWFHLRGPERDSCPCQNYSDSGHALDSRCDAVIHWHQPDRFRRVCPLLQETPEGWRCSVDAERVRPFWGRAALYSGVFFLLLYLSLTLAAFATLRLAKYDLPYLALLWPPRWSEVRGAQERLYANRAQQAITAGNYQEAILSLEMVCQLNPRNYSAGLALASLTRVAARAAYSEGVYERLMRDVPEQRLQTAQIWLRTLLASAAFEKIKPLAATMLGEDASERSAWLHAMLFAARTTGDSQFLSSVLDQRSAHLPDWCIELISLERSLLQNHTTEALPRLTRVYRQPESAYVPYYQVDRLLRHGYLEEALKLLTTYGARVPADEAAFLHLRLYRAKGWASLLATERESLQRFPPSPRIAAQFCASLISEPDPALLTLYLDKLFREGPPLAAETLPLYYATYLAAMRSGDQKRAEVIVTQIMQFTRADARVLRGLAEVLPAGRSDPRLARMLPLIPLPTEVVYAALERQTVAGKK